MSETRTASSDAASPTQTLKVWDLPTRIFHWGLAIAILVAYLSDEFSNFRVHLITGAVILGLLLFRLIWGFIGSETSRFDAFFPTPARLRAYVDAIRTKQTHLLIGHNPVGAAMVFALLLLVSLQVVTGMFSTVPDSYVPGFDGPLAKYVGADLTETFTEIHEFLFNVLLVLVVLHVLASVFHLVVKHDNLIGPMVVGVKGYPQNAGVQAPRMRSLWVAVPLALVVATVVWMLFTQA